MVELDAALLRNKKPVLPPGHSQGVTSFALCGLGGVGKSQIAIEYAHSRKGQFNAVFWVSADSSAKLDESYEQLAIAMGLLEAGDARDFVISRSIFLEWLSTPHGERQNSGADSFPASEALHWLMVLDNADNLKNLQDFWPTGNSGSILITSRDPLAKSYAHLSSGLGLQPFNVTETATLLQKLSGNPVARPTEEISLQTLSQHLGGLPLAIAQFAATIKYRDLTYEEILGVLLGDNLFMNLQKLKLTQEGDTGTYNDALATTWTFSQLTPPVTRLLELLAILDPDSIQESIVAPDEDLDVLPDYPSSKDAYYEARKDLWKSSLIIRNKPLQQLSLHRLTQDVARARMSKTRLLETFEFALKLLWKAWPKGPHVFAHVTTTWKAAEAVYPHIRWLHLLFKSQKLYMGSKIECELARMIQKGGW